MRRHPSRTDEGQIAMVIDGYPGKMQIAGRVVRLGLWEMQNLADGRVFERFMVKLYDTSTPYGDRYQDTFKMASMYLELCNISDSGSYCYEHGREHKFGTTWDIPTPPRFATVEEADAWMEQKALERRVVDNVRAAAECPDDPCLIHGCVGPHDADLAVAFPGRYELGNYTSVGPVTLQPGDTYTVTSTYNLSP